MDPMTCYYHLFSFSVILFHHSLGIRFYFGLLAYIVPYRDEHDSL